MADDIRTYRHEATGRIGRYDPRVALADPRLIEVPEGTKPLAYTSIPQEVVEQALALQNSEEKAPESTPARKRSK